jgi:hypothetical protein
MFTNCHLCLQPIEGAICWQHASLTACLTLPLPLRNTGGRGVIDEIEKQLALTPEYVEPSRATLYRYGNISSSSIW